MGHWLARTWRKKGLAACLLWPLSLLYGRVTGFHRWLYRAGILTTRHFAVPVIVVGNVVAGGAGKTPLVIALAKHLLGQGLYVGVVSRGYGRQIEKCLEVNENTPISQSGDEPALIFSALAAPVFVAKNRSEAIDALLAKFPRTQLVISDDGLQHHSLAIDIKITVFDDRGVGNGWLLPAGPLRERFALDRQDMVLHTGQHPAFGGFTSTRRLANFALAADGTQVQLSDLKHQPLTALAGIANPDAFFAMLRAQGLLLTRTIALPDHFDFSEYQFPGQAGNVVLCTEKDAAKLFKMRFSASQKLLAVPLEFAPEPAFFKAIDDLLPPLLRKGGINLPSAPGEKNGHQTT